MCVDVDVTMNGADTDNTVTEPGQQQQQQQQQHRLDADNTAISDVTLQSTVTNLTEQLRSHDL